MTKVNDPFDINTLPCNFPYITLILILELELSSPSNRSQYILDVVCQYKAHGGKRLRCRFVQCSLKGQCHRTNRSLGPNVKRQIVWFWIFESFEINAILVFGHYLSISFEYWFLRKYFGFIISHIYLSTDRKNLKKFPNFFKFETRTQASVHTMNTYILFVTYILFLPLTLFQFATEHYLLNTRQSSQNLLLNNLVLKRRQNNILSSYDLILVELPLLHLPFSTLFSTVTKTTTWPAGGRLMGCQLWTLGVNMRHTVEFSAL